MLARHAYCTDLSTITQCKNKCIYVYKVRSLRVRVIFDLLLPEKRGRGSEEWVGGPSHPPPP